jgi:hypothetical protein
VRRGLAKPVQTPRNGGKSDPDYDTFVRKNVNSTAGDGGPYALLFRSYKDICFLSLAMAS